MIIRAAERADASAAVDVVRRSIVELCAADHKGDAETLATWLKNKTTDHFVQWIANENNYFAIAADQHEVLGVGIVNRSGEVSLMYLAPHAVRRGLGRALYAALEAKARAWGLERLRLESTTGARPFYEALGFRPLSCSAAPRFGVLSCYQYEKILTWSPETVVTTM